jgi:hypothetical protein
LFGDALLCDEQPETLVTTSRHADVHDALTRITETNSQSKYIFCKWNF